MTPAGFNPHPPLLAGETQRGHLLHGVELVSIHTRHYWRVKRGQAINTADPVQVSIHTRHYWRVKPSATRWPMTWRQFQSTPAITGG